MAVCLSEKEGGNKFVIELAALLHDIADWKLTNNSADGMNIIRNWLSSQQIDIKTIDTICEIIDNVSFKGAGVSSQMHTLEGKIVQDADRIDALGAIGIARTFAYGGAKGREMHNPNIEPTMHQSFDDYKKNQSTTINHFYEKLLLLKDQMNTETAKKIAIERHQFLENFLIQFLNEWQGA
jgi:uncharacterized protein